MANFSDIYPINLLLYNIISVRSNQGLLVSGIVQGGALVAAGSPLLPRLIAVLSTLVKLIP